MTCLGHVALLDIDVFGAILSGALRREARPGSIITRFDGAQKSVLDREAS